MPVRWPSETGYPGRRLPIRDKGLAAVEPDFASCQRFDRGIADDLDARAGVVKSERLGGTDAGRSPVLDRVGRCPSRGVRSNLGARMLSRWPPSMLRRCHGASTAHWKWDQTVCGCQTMMSSASQVTAPTGGGVAATTLTTRNCLCDQSGPVSWWAVRLAPPGGGRATGFRPRAPGDGRGPAR